MLNNLSHLFFQYEFFLSRQLGAYKKFARNTRYREGCIGEAYIEHECVLFGKLCIHSSPNPNTSEQLQSPRFKISVYSTVVKPKGIIRKKRLTKEELDVAHWCVMQNYNETKYYIEKHA